MFYLLFLLVAKLVFPVIASPYHAYPVNQQTPPVAILEKPFQLQISNDTYKSTNGAAIVYTAVDLPQWVTWDTGSRSLSGVCPEEFLEGEETKYFPFTLQGTDMSDQVSINVSYQLVATSRPPIQVNPSFNVLDILRPSGATNGKNALKLSPGEEFAVQFNKDVFLPTDESHPITAFYGRSQQYHSPLPSWISFDPYNLKFTGTAPAINSELAPEQYFSFSLLATEFEGYSGAEIPFMINVSARQFTTNLSNTLVINVTDNGSFNYPVPLEYVFLDGNNVQKEDVTMTLENPPAWIKLEDHNLVGTLPNDISQYNVSVAIHDVYSDVVYLDFNIESTQRIFATNTLPDFNATRGTWFQRSLSPSQFTSFDDTEIEPKFSGADWLHYSKSNLTFSGIVPNDFESVVINVKATRLGKEESLSFKLVGVDKTSSNSTAFALVSSSSSSTVSSTMLPLATSLVPSSTILSSSSSTAAVAYQSKKNNVSRTVAIACGVSIPLAILLFLILLLLVYFKNSKSRKDDSIEDIEHSPKVISGPRLGNRANNPNPFADGNAGLKSAAPEKPINPFSDENSIESAKKLAVLNAMYLEERSSPTSTDDEKDEQHFGSEKGNSDSDHYQDATDDTDNALLSAADRNDSVYFTGDPKISTVYYNSEPSKRKSWRYSSHMSKQAPAGNRDSEATRESYVSIQTVSTAELLNTEISPNKDLKQDPKKSTLGPRDSVFMQKSNRHPSERSQSSLTMLEPLQEVSGKADTSVEDSTLRLSSSSGGSDFIPVKQGETYQFTPKKSRPSTPDGAEHKSSRSVKRLVNLPNKGGVNVSDVALIGQEPERD